MPPSKSDKELAYLRDLFIAPDWGVRFNQLVDEHVTLPDKGRALYLAGGTGGHALALTERSATDLKLLCVDESNECLELARAKAITTEAAIEFQRDDLAALDLPDDHFDLVIGDGSLQEPQRAAVIFAEMARVAAPGATVALSLPTSSSFGEFFSIYWEALHNSGCFDHEIDVADLITGLPTISDVEEMATREGLEEITSWTRIEEFDYDSGEDFLNAPLIADFLMPNWLRSIPAESRERVESEIAHLINEERRNAEFSLTVKATLVVGRKVDMPLAG